MCLASRDAAIITAILKDKELVLKLALSIKDAANLETEPFDALVQRGKWTASYQAAKHRPKNSPLPTDDGPLNPHEHTLGILRLNPASLYLASLEGLVEAIAHNLIHAALAETSREYDHTDTFSSIARRIGLRCEGKGRNLATTPNLESLSFQRLMAAARNVLGERESSFIPYQPKGKAKARAGKYVSAVTFLCPNGCGTWLAQKPVKHTLFCPSCQAGLRAE
jgi:hypothetical protein